MKKNTARGLIVLALLLCVFSVVAFIVPFAKTVTFWLAFGFGVFAMLFQLYIFRTADAAGGDAKSRFYGFPIARIGVIYAIVQLVVSLVVMALSLFIPWWIPMLVYAIALGAALIGLISVDAVVDQIQTMDTKLKKDVSAMRALQTKASQMAAQSGDAALKALAEEFRYSDPVSSDAIAEAEADLAAAVDQLQTAYVDGDKDAMAQLCRKASALLAERNRLCKLNKN